jgi:hypothetical protein
MIYREEIISHLVQSPVPCHHVDRPGPRAQGSWIGLGQHQTRVYQAFSHGKNWGFPPGTPKFDDIFCINLGLNSTG